MGGIGKMTAKEVGEAASQCRPVPSDTVKATTIVMEEPLGLWAPAATRMTRPAEMAWETEVANTQARAAEACGHTSPEHHHSECMQGHKCPFRDNRALDWVLSGVVDPVKCIYRRKTDIGRTEDTPANP